MARAHQPVFSTGDRHDPLRCCRLLRAPLLWRNGTLPVRLSESNLNFRREQALVVDARSSLHEARGHLTANLPGELQQPMVISSRGWLLHFVSSLARPSPARSDRFRRLTTAASFALCFLVRPPFAPRSAFSRPVRCFATCSTFKWDYISNLTRVAARRVLRLCCVSLANGEGGGRGRELHLQAL